jgi:dolichol kinase
MNVALFIIISFVLLFVVEIVKRKLKTSNDLSRRLAHVGAGLINIAAPLFVSHVAIIIVNITFAGLLLAGRNTRYFSSVQTTKRQTYGDVYFPLGIIAAAIVLLPDNVTAFQYGVAIMGISDALAGFVGERWGRKTISILGNPKTLTGALVFYFSSLVITFIFAPQLIPIVFVLPLILTTVEFVLVYGLDNLILPVVSGLLFLTFL